MSRYIKESALISDFIDDNGITQIETYESLLKKWIREEVRLLEIPEKMKDFIAHLPINNYKVELPDNHRILCEVAYKKREKKDEDCKVIGHRITQWVQRTMDGCELEMNLKCPNCHKTTCNCNTEGIVVDIDRIWEMSHPEVYYQGYTSSHHFNRGDKNVPSRHDHSYTLMCPTQNPWFGARHLPDCANIHCKECPASYKVEDWGLDTTVKDGWALISYIGSRVDEDGDFLIDANDMNAIKAIQEYLKYKWHYREYQQKREPASRALYQEAFQMNAEYAARYLSAGVIPAADEFMTWWAKSKWNKIDSAYDNLLRGKKPKSTLVNKNIYKS